MSKELKFSGKDVSFETIYADVENNGYGQILSHIITRIEELHQDMQLVAEGSEQYEAYNGLIQKYQTCFELMPLIIQEATYRYVAYRATPEDLQAITEEAMAQAAE